MLGDMTWFELALLVPLIAAIVTLLDDNLLRYVYKSPAMAACFAGIFGGLPLLTRPFIHSDTVSISVALAAFLAGLLTLVYYYFYFKGLSSDSPSVVVLS